MRARLIWALLGFATCLAAAGPARAADFSVTSTIDSPSGSCGPVDATGVHPCTNLRAAVAAANASLDAEDNILLTFAGTYAQDELTLQDGVTLFGIGPRSVRITNPQGRILRIPAGAEVLVAGVTIADGSVVEQSGGNILNEGTLDLIQTHVTGGFASYGSGGGISNTGGILTINESLIDDNDATFSGGGIDNESATLNISDSTLASNTGSTGSAIGTSGTGSTVSLVHVTFNVNVPGTTLTIANSGQDVTTYGSIFTTNVGSTPLCGALKPTDVGYNLDRGTSCAFTGTGSVSNVDPLLSGGLTNQGGPTDLFSITTASPAANLVATCESGLDQRGYLRSASPFEACDAGAYEIGGTPIVAIPTPTPTPTPPVQTPVPTVTPAPTPTATPVAGQSVGATEVRGKVLVKLPGTNKFVDLEPSVIKNGAEVDARHGAVEITRPDGGKATFYDGIFKLSEVKRVTTLTLSEKLTGCKKSKKKASAAAKKPKTRKLWGNGKGKFRTRGQYGAATIRGTKWLVADTCTTTTITVKQGAVTAEDLVKKKRAIVRKGKKFTAKAKR